MAKKPTKKEEVNLEEEGLTPEEYAKAREEAKKHLLDEIEYLKVEKEWATLTADVEEQKARRLVFMTQQARVMAPPPQEEGDQDAVERPSKRTLKRAEA